MTAVRFGIALRVAVVGSLMLAACSDADSGSAPSGSDPVQVDSTAPSSGMEPGAEPGAEPTLPPAGPWSTGTVDDRPYRVFVPASGAAGAGIDAAGVDAPLVLLLHGYTGSAETVIATTDVVAEAGRRGAVVVVPDGQVDSLGNRFWKATEACCDFWDSGDDDSEYLARVIGAVRDEYRTDPDRVLVIGHSNGGFMAYRMACDHADLVSGIASLAGAMHLDPADCSPGEPVRVVQVHGTADVVVGYEGGRVLGGPPHPGALDSVRMWAGVNGCTGRDPVTRPGRLDVDATVAGPESVLATVDGCPAEGTVALITAEGGGHLPIDGTDLAPTLFDLLLESTRP